MSISPLTSATSAPPLTALMNGPATNLPLSAYNASGVVPQSPQDQQIIRQALARLGQIQNLPADERYLYGFVGINPLFKNGAEALQLIQSRNLRVEFGDMGESPAHAQWIADQGLIMVNQRYRGDSAPDTIRAIAEAIYHEAGHARDGDGESSIQEESDCLALNTMAHRFHEAKDPQYAANASQSPLMANGVALYPKLFFDADPNRQALVDRIVTKYGDLPVSSPNHAVPVLPGGQKPLASVVAEKAAQALPKETLNVLPSLPQASNALPVQTSALITPPVTNAAPINGQQLATFG